MMRVPNVHGTIRRRILVNDRVDPDVLESFHDSLAVVF